MADKIFSRVGSHISENLPLCITCLDFLKQNIDLGECNNLLFLHNYILIFRF